MLDFFIKLMDGIPEAILLIIGCAVGIMYLKLKDLEGVRKNATDIAKTPDRITEIHNIVTKSINDLSRKVDALSSSVAALHSKTVIQSDSPISLNEYGRVLSEKMDALSIAAQYKRELVRKARKQAMNAYQIQQSCFDFSVNEILRNLEKNDKEQYNRLTDIAYKEGVRVEVLTQILGVVLRDQVLADVSKSVEEIAGERKHRMHG